jgi:hypothetical protein
MDKKRRKSVHVQYRHNNRRPNYIVLIVLVEDCRQTV